MEKLKNLDRRWIFLAMFVAVAVPILLQLQFPEKPTGLAENTFKAIEDLPDGSNVMLAFDFDPASEGELGPMATAFAYHCAAKKHKMFFMALWPVGPQMIQNVINNVIIPDFPEMQYGRDYVNLGYKSGNEGVIKVIVTDFRELYTTDHYGTAFDEIPMCREIESVQDMDLVVNASAGYPGTKEWVQYAVTAFPDEITLVGGCTGVQAPLLYPYIPSQLPGLLAAIKGASEYEQLVVERYGLEDNPKYSEGRRRMGPQLVAHLLMILLIIMGNVIFFYERKQKGGEPMKRETLVWTIILGVGLVLVLLNAGLRGAGKAYMKTTPMEFADVGTAAEPNWVDVSSDEALDHDVEAVPEAKRIRWTRYDQTQPRDFVAAQARDANQTTYRFSLARTAGVWLAALFTLFIFSFLYKDNPLYKIAESVSVGVTAAYWMVVGFWAVIVPNLVGKISPSTVKGWAMPGLDVEAELVYLFPLTLGVMLLWRLAPKGAWIARWPLAFIVGTTAGMRLLAFIHADFLSQIRNSILPLVVLSPDGGFLLWDSLKAIILVIGVLSGLVYFFFSIEHTGVVGKTAKLGIWFLMVTFGAAFGYTVMGRIALLAIRLEFLFDDWLWLIDPTNKRAAMEILGTVWSPLAAAIGLA